MTNKTEIEITLRLCEGAGGQVHHTEEQHTTLSSVVETIMAAVASRRTYEHCRLVLFNLERRAECTSATEMTSLDPSAKHVRNSVPIGSADKLSAMIENDWRYDCYVQYFHPSGGVSVQELVDKDASTERHPFSKAIAWLGGAGWELVSVQHDGDSIYAYFRRLVLPGRATDEP